MIHESSKRRAAAFSLIELIIAFTLIAVVFSSFTALFWHFSRYEIIMEEKTRDFGILQMRASQLKSILSKAIFGNDTKFCFYSTEEESHLEKGLSLVFTYHAGIDPDPDFANVNIGKLFLDDGGNLILASWPDPKVIKKDPPPMRKEILFTDVSAFSMRFFCCKEPPARIGQSSTPERGVWLDKWEKEFRMQPQIVEISITFTDATKEPLLFPCLIPRGFPAIEY